MGTGAPERRRRAWQLGAALLFALVLVAAAVGLSAALSSRDTSDVLHGPVRGVAEVRAELAGVPEHGIVLGRPSAPVTLVELGDLKCPVCAAFAIRTLPELVRRYVRPGKLRIVFRAQHFVGERSAPGDSLRAARMAEAAGLQDRLWPFVALVYRNQGPEDDRYVSDAYLRRIGRAVPGLNVPRALAQRSSPLVAAQLDEAARVFDEHGFTGTPSFLLGGRGRPLAPVSPRADDPGAFAQRIDAVLR